MSRINIVFYHYMIDKGDGQKIYKKKVMLENLLKKGIGAR
jgi:hypothetical protein